MNGDVPAKYNVYTLYIRIYVWFWPTLKICSQNMQILGLFTPSYISGSYPNIKVSVLLNNYLQCFGDREKPSAVGCNGGIYNGLHTVALEDGVKQVAQALWCGLSDSFRKFIGSNLQ